ncbi:MAG: acetyl-CoA carboxylase, carboxyltransferase subunit beta [Armatimonadetes bacterium]|nr:acetyl-CoA carboxylase, carboxyltransferase subunit beta [Armatimonadota bacterium]
MPAGRGKTAIGNFAQCKKCKKTLFAAEFLEAMWVCNHCGHHHRLSSEQRIACTFDEGSFVELDSELVSQDPLQFPEYADKVQIATEKTGLNDGVISGRAKIDGMPVAAAIADFSFMGGSMGSVGGEKITRTLERAVDDRCPVVIFCSSGGARMQEGLLSLMQMPKTTAAVQRCKENGIPYISVFTDPTMAGVLASYASVADVILAEPKALVGFAGARVSKQAQVVKPPKDFQTAEFVARAGMLDKIVDRREMRGTLIALIKILGAHLRKGAKRG